jgi:hypothetical protein
MSTAIYMNDNDDYFIPPAEVTEEDEWREKRMQIESINDILVSKHKKMAADMVGYIYNNLASVPGFEVVPIYYDIPECRVTIHGMGTKRNLMYMIKIDRENMYYISISSLHSLEEKRFEETPKDMVDTLIDTQRVYLSK